MSAYEKKLSSRIKEGVGALLAEYTPGFCLQVVERGKLRADLKIGQTYKYYDLASLTKIIFTVPVMMDLVQHKKLRLQDSVSDLWPPWNLKFDTSVARVLSHSAGLPWWAPFYKKYKGKPLSRDQIQKILLQELKKGERQKRTTIQAVYSDLDFILLGFLMEEILQAPLTDIWQNLVWTQRSEFHFNVDNKPLHKRGHYAPTERCPWRKKILQGEVHDDNAWCFGGVSTHAGLFGTIEDVTGYGRWLRQSYRGDREWISPSVTKKFCRRAVPQKSGDWALGFMLPTRGSASCGRYFHSTSFGHTGFTGTSLWYDPRRDLLVTLLANRVHPTRNNTRFTALRPLIHDWVVECL